MDTVTILLVEDNPDDAELLQIHLGESTAGAFKITHVQRLQDAVACLQTHRFDLILLDPGLPDSRGLDTFLNLKESSGDIPVIILSGNNDESLAVEAVRRGGQDYLVKGRTGAPELSRAIRYAIERGRLFRELKRATERLVEQQRSVVEEERLKVLLQLAGATALELHQPLADLLEATRAISTSEGITPQLADQLESVKKAGYRIQGMIDRVQSIGYEGFVQPGGNLVPELSLKRLGILVLEPADPDFHTLQSLLQASRARIHRARSIAETLEILETTKMDILLLDYLLPDGNAMECIGKLQSNDIDVPTVVVTGNGNETIAAHLIQAGAYDYLPKARLSQPSLYRSIATALEKNRLRKELKTTQAQLAEMATRDGLTGLFNRRYCDEAIYREIARANRYGTRLGFCLIDIDDFKHVNDDYGHCSGDMVLQEISKTILASVRETDLACRYGGEEFAIILPQTCAEEARVVCDRIRQQIAAQVFRTAVRFSVTVSLGISIYDPDDPDCAKRLVDQADQALYRAKGEGKNRISIVTEPIAALV